MTDQDFSLGTFSSATSARPAYCLGAFFDLTLSARSSTVIQWIIGDAFLKNVYSAYRYYPTPAVGFAQLSPGFLSLSPKGNLTDATPSLRPSALPNATSVNEQAVRTSAVQSSASKLVASLSLLALTLIAQRTL